MAPLPSAVPAETLSWCHGHSPSLLSINHPVIVGVMERAEPGTCRLQSVADLGVKSSIVAVTVMPELVLILQAILEGVGAL